MESANNDYVINIDKIKIENCNRIIIVIDDKPVAESLIKEKSTINNDRVYKSGFAKTFYQYKLGHFDFKRDDKKAQDFANTSEKFDMFIDIYNAAKRVIRLQSKIPWSVFFGIACICVDCGKNQKVKEGIREIYKTLLGMKSNSLGIRDFNEGNPVHELCRFILKTEWKHPASGDARRLMANVATVFWNAYLEDSILDGFSRKVYSERFIKLSCVEK